MTDEKPLYEDEQLKIDYLGTSIDDHELIINNEYSYVIPRGILEELATTKRGNVARKIHAFNELILYAIDKEGIGVDGLHVALCQAYIEEKERIRRVSLEDIDDF